MRWPRFSRFERRILGAIFLCATTPFVISIVFIPLIIESRLALAMHDDVRAQLERSAVFFKEFFDAKKAEYSARAETISRDPILIRAARDREPEDVRVRLQQFVDDIASLQELRVFADDGTLLAKVTGPADRQGEGFVPKTIALPLGLGEAPRLEAVFILARAYLTDRAQAEQISTLYDFSLRTTGTRANNYYRAYFAIALVVMLLAVTVGYFLSRAVTKRIANLAQATERVAQGEYGFTVPVGGNDEITELTDGFNRMIHEVAQARDRIVYLEKVSGWQELARRLAHEIKNPLTPSRRASQELRRRAPDDDGRFRRLVDESTDMVEEEIGALTRLVDEFSRFAKLPEVMPAPVEVRDFLEDFLSAYNNFEPEAQVTLDTPAVPVVAGIDRVLMRRVLHNLVTNAIQAAGPGRAELTISCAFAPKDRIELRVEDNGPGVPDDEVQKVFEPYFTTKSTGTGLGLASVKKIVLQHRGTIFLHRAPAGGACFVITLPAMVSA
ncbi:MAG: ATP-binding protein [Myxococcota bacterium]